MDRDVPVGRPLCSRPVEDLLLLLGGIFGWGWRWRWRQAETGHLAPGGRRSQLERGEEWAHGC